MGSRIVNHCQSNIDGGNSKSIQGLALEAWFKWYKGMGRVCGKFQIQVSMATKNLLMKKKKKNQYKDFSSNVSIYSFYGCFCSYAVKVYLQQTPKNLGASSFAVMLDPFWYILLNDKSVPQSMYRLCLFIVVCLGAFLLNNVSP